MPCPSEDKINRLTETLVAEAHACIGRVEPHEKLGSLNLWFDEYGASLGFSPWLPNEAPWAMSQDNNVDLEGWDVFDDDEVDKICGAAERAFARVHQSSEFSKLVIRDGFQCTVSLFDPPSIYYRSEALPGEAVPAITEEEAISLLCDCVVDSLGQLPPSPLQKITFSTSDHEVSISLATDQSLANRGGYFRYPAFDVGMAMVLMARQGIESFQRLCEALLERPEVRAFPKRHLCVLILIQSVDDSHVRVLENDSLRELDEDHELKLLYGNLDD